MLRDTRRDRRRPWRSCAARCGLARRVGTGARRPTSGRRWAAPWSTPGVRARACGSWTVLPPSSTDCRWRACSCAGRWVLELHRWSDFEEGADDLRRALRALRRLGRRGVGGARAPPRGPDHGPGSATSSRGATRVRERHRRSARPWATLRRRCGGAQPRAGSRSSAATCRARFERYADASARFDALGVDQRRPRLRPVHRLPRRRPGRGRARRRGARARRAPAAADGERADLLLALAGAALAAGDPERAASAADGGASPVPAAGAAAALAQGRALRDLCACRSRAAGPPDCSAGVRALVVAAREAACPRAAAGPAAGRRSASRVRSARAAGAGGRVARGGGRLPQRATGPTRALGWLALAQATRELAATRRGAPGLRARARTRSTRTRPPSAATSCAPCRRATAPTWPSSAPARRSPRVTHGSCCGGPSGGARPRCRRPPATSRTRRGRPRPTWPPYAPSTAASPRLAPTECRRTRLQARATRLEQPVRQRLLPRARHRGGGLVPRRRRPPRGARRGRHGPRRAGRDRRRAPRARGGSWPRTPPRGRHRGRLPRGRRLRALHAAPGGARPAGPARRRGRPAPASPARPGRWTALGESRVVVSRAPRPAGRARGDCCPRWPHDRSRARRRRGCGCGPRVDAAASRPRVMLVGPGLGSGGAEVPAVAAAGPGGRGARRRPRDRRGRRSRPSTAPRWPTWPRTVTSARTARSSPRSPSPTGPCSCTTSSGCGGLRTGSCSRPASRASCSRWATRSCSAWPRRCCRWAPPAWSRASPRSTTPRPSR